MIPILRLLTEDKSEISLLKMKVKKAEALLAGFNQVTDNQATRLESLEDSMTSKIDEIKNILKDFKIKQLKGKYTNLHLYAQELRRFCE